MLTFIVSPTFEFRILVLDASRFFDIWHSKFDIRYYIFVFNIRYFDVQCSNIFDTLIGIDILSICCFNLDLLIFFGMYTWFGSFFFFFPTSLLEGNGVPLGLSRSLSLFFSLSPFLPLFVIDFTRPVICILYTDTLSPPPRCHLTIDKFIRRTWFGRL